MSQLGRNENFLRPHKKLDELVHLLSTGKEAKRSKREENCTQKKSFQAIFYWPQLCAANPLKEKLMICNDLQRAKES